MPEKGCKHNKTYVQNWSQKIDPKSADPRRVKVPYEGEVSSTLLSSTPLPPPPWASRRQNMSPIRSLHSIRKLEPTLAQMDQILRGGIG